MARGAAVAGWGSVLGARRVTNAELAQRLGIDDEWIVRRTGIRERWLGGTTGELGARAAQLALESAGLAPEQIGLLILTTNTPDRAVPATATAIQDSLGLHCGAFDLLIGCSGFVYGMVVAHGLVTTGFDHVLLVGAESLSRITDPNDRSTAPILGDGAGAVVLEATPGEDRMLGWDLGADGSAADILSCEHGGYVRMDGGEVFHRAVRAAVVSARVAMDRAKVGVDEISLFVPHQANVRMMEAIASRLGIPGSRIAVMVDRVGNTSAASVPMALADAVEAGRLADGDLVLLSGFGAGLSWGSLVLRWGR